jgi:hypothetical protein
VGTFPELIEADNDRLLDIFVRYLNVLVLGGRGLLLVHCLGILDHRQASAQDCLLFQLSKRWKFHVLGMIKD